MGEPAVEPEPVDDAAADEAAVRSVVEAWKSIPDLVNFAAGGVMARIGKDSELDRQEVCQNKKLLGPVLLHLGFLAEEGKLPHVFAVIGDVCILTTYEKSIEIKHSNILGLRPAVDDLAVACEQFLHFSRPRGKKLPTSVCLIGFPHHMSCKVISSRTEVNKVIVSQSELLYFRGESSWRSPCNQETGLYLRKGGQKGSPSKRGRH